MNSLLFVVGTFVILGLLPNYAGANYTCTGPIKGVTVDPLTGNVVPGVISGITRPVMCSLEQTRNGVSPNMCKQILAVLLTAQVSGKNVVLWFKDDATGGNCATHGQWTDLSGWYYGPQME